MPGSVPAVPGSAPAVPGSVPAVPGSVPAAPGSVPAAPGSVPAAPGSVPGAAPSGVVADVADEFAFPSGGVTADPSVPSVASLLPTASAPSSPMLTGLYR